MKTRLGFSLLWSFPIWAITSLVTQSISLSLTPVFILVSLSLALQFILGMQKYAFVKDTPTTREMSLQEWIKAARAFILVLVLTIMSIVIFNLKVVNEVSISALLVLYFLAAGIHTAVRCTRTNLKRYKLL